MVEIVDFEKVKDIMNERGISQVELANRMDITQGHLSMLFYGRRRTTLDILFALLNALNLTFQDVLKDEYLHFAG
ncbi:helix-turn-helix domain-containing protein [Herbiconiux daphne]|uniref:Helix-turn-helix transcriptional regulator n=1 Tax=Herbiconiux daphne TaxID=2970914 RepID=A0ABT2HAJ7_9MICO|nr:helix-turn-helix transcriptional regulator [Herbiconiux daphne]MCS5736886.1 helix-turn-helix transcriptional regulator [Herbiconiux daphne]